MKIYRVISIATIVGCFASSANAATFDFDCDPMTDHTSKVTFHVTGEQTVVRGEFTLKDYRRGAKRTQPGIGLWIANADNSKSVGFQLIDESGDSRTFAAAFNSYNGTGTRRGLGTVNITQPISFELTFSSEGSATLKLGQLSKAIVVPTFSPANVNAFCVSSQFKFWNVELSDNEDRDLEQGHASSGDASFPTHSSTP